MTTFPFAFTRHLTIIAKSKFWNGQFRTGFLVDQKFLSKEISVSRKNEGKKVIFPARRQVKRQPIICALDELERGIVWRYDQGLAKTVDAKSNQSYSKRSRRLDQNAWPGSKDGIDKVKQVFLHGPTHFLYFISFLPKCWPGGHASSPENQQLSHFFCILLQFLYSHYPNFCITLEDFWVLQHFTQVFK